MFIKNMLCFVFTLIVLGLLLFRSDTVKILIEQRSHLVSNLEMLCNAGSKSISSAGENPSIVQALHHTQFMQ